MTRKRHTEEQIITVLKDAQTGIGCRSSAAYVSSPQS